MCKTTIMTPEQELEIVKTELNQLKENKKQSHRRFYANKFKILPDMTDEEKEQVQANIDKRNAQARARYKNNKLQRERQKARAREYAAKKRSSKSDNTSSVVSSSQD